MRYFRIRIRKGSSLEGRKMVRQLAYSFMDGIISLIENALQRNTVVDPSKGGLGLLDSETTTILQVFLS